MNRILATFAAPIFDWSGVTHSLYGPLFVNMNDTGAGTYLGGLWCGSRQSAEASQLVSTVYRIVVRPKSISFSVRVQ